MYPTGPGFVKKRMAESLLPGIIQNQNLQKLKREDFQTWQKYFQVRKNSGTGSGFSAG